MKKFRFAVAICFFLAIVFVMPGLGQATNLRQAGRLTFVRLFSFAMHRSSPEFSYTRLDCGLAMTLGAMTLRQPVRSVDHAEREVRDPMLGLRRWRRKTLTLQPVRHPSDPMA